MSLDAAIKVLSVAGFPLEDLPGERADPLWATIATTYTLSLPQLSALKNYRCSTDFSLPTPKKPKSGTSETIKVAVGTTQGSKESLPVVTNAVAVSPVTWTSFVIPPGDREEALRLQGKVPLKETPKLDENHAKKRKRDAEEQKDDKKDEKENGKKRKQEESGVQPIPCLHGEDPEKKAKRKEARKQERVRREEKKKKKEQKKALKLQEEKAKRKAERKLAKAKAEQLASSSSTPASSSPSSSLALASTSSCLSSSSALSSSSLPSSPSRSCPVPPSSSCPPPVSVSSSSSSSSSSDDNSPNNIAPSLPASAPATPSALPKSKTEKTPKKSKKGRFTVQELVVGKEYAGKVVTINAHGAFIDVGCHSDGFCHVSRLSDGFVQNTSDVVKPGDSVTARVLSVAPSTKNPKKTLITLSLQSELMKETEQASLLKFTQHKVKPNEASSSQMSGPKASEKNTPKQLRRNQRRLAKKSEPQGPVQKTVNKRVIFS